MQSQIDDCIDVLTRLSGYFFSHLTYDTNYDALRFFAYWVRSSGLFNGTDVTSTIFFPYFRDLQVPICQLSESPVLPTSSILPAPLKLRSRIS